MLAGYTHQGFFPKGATNQPRSGRVGWVEEVEQPDPLSLSQTLACIPTLPILLLFHLEVLFNYDIYFPCKDAKNLPL